MNTKNPKLKNIVFLSKGGQKTVYRADHDDYGAIVIKEGVFSTLSSLERIKREVNFLRSVRSNYFPRNYEFNIDLSNNQFSIVEEYIDSENLYIASSRFDTEEAITKLFITLISALNILWEQNIIHRDLKPDNILIRSNNQPVVIDLGIARFLNQQSLTKTCQITGPCTPNYASPEQLLNQKNAISIRTDFYSLGIVFFELAFKVHPFDPQKVGVGSSIPENIISNQRLNTTQLKKFSEDFVHLLDKLLSYQPYLRFRTYLDLEKYVKERWRK
jgi:eukaryotic-like serine/threonine-protein kinase